MPNIEQIVVIANNGGMSTLTDSHRQGSFTSNEGDKTKATVSGSDLDKLQSLKMRVFSYSTRECYTFEFLPEEGSTGDGSVFAHIGEEALGSCAIQYLIVNGQIMWVIPSPEEGVVLTVKVLEDFESVGKVSLDGSSPYTSAYNQKLPGTPRQITAIPSGGYVFDKWSDGNTSAERTVSIDEDTTLYAWFKPGNDESLIEQPYVSAVKIGVGDNLQSLDRDNLELTFTVDENEYLILEVHGVKVNMADKAYIGARITSNNSSTLINLDKQEGSTSDVAVYTWQNRFPSKTYEYKYLEIGTYKCWAVPEE